MYPLNLSDGSFDFSVTFGLRRARILICEGLDSKVKGSKSVYLPMSLVPPVCAARKLPVVGISTSVLSALRCSEGGLGSWGVKYLGEGLISMVYG